MSGLSVERRPVSHRLALALVPVMMVGAVLFSSWGGEEHRKITGGAVGAAGGAIVGAVAGAPLVGAVVGAAGGAALAELISAEVRKGNWPCVLGCATPEIVKPAS